MKAWHIDKSNTLKLAESSLIEKEGEIKVKLSKVAMSSIDMTSFSNRDNESVTIPAHSAIAYMGSDCEELGLKLGSRVLVSPFVKSVEHGETVIRTMGVDIDGLLRDFVCLPVANIHSLPDGIADEDAVFAEYIAMGNKVFSALSCNVGDYVVIVGAGTLGLVLCQMAMYYQMVPILVDMDSEKLELARKWDVYYTLNPTYDNLERKVVEITGGRMSEAAVFTSEGVGLGSALRLVKNGSEVVIAGYPTYEKHNVDMETVLKKQLKLKGVFDGAGEMPSAINLLANSIVHTNGIITERADFEDAPRIFEDCVKYPYKYNTVLFSID